MLNALNTAASGMEAQMEQIEHITNNLSNVNTNGFKKTRAEFQDLLYETLQEPGANTSALTQAPVGLQRGMGVKVAGTQRSFELGPPKHTARDLDLYIGGDGFFPVQLPDGETAYRRDGTFYRASTGRIETIDGYPLLPEITVPPSVRKVEIAEDGQVTGMIDGNNRISLGQIQLAAFSNNGGLKAMGKNLFVSTESSGPASLERPGQNNVGGLQQFYIEGSNVDMVREMTEMIKSQRAFEMNAKVLQSVDQVLQNTSNLR